MIKFARRYRLHISTGLLLAALSACSASGVTAGRSDGPTQQRFGAEDRRIARKLSIGGDEVRSDASPQYQAMLCSLALASIESRMLDGGVLSSAQQRAFKDAEGLYRRRAAAGLTSQARDKLRNDVTTAYPEQSDRARFAIGCLRDLA